MYDCNIKQCSSCGKWFKANLIHFPARKSSRDGLRGQCRECKRLVDMRPDIKDARNKRRKDKLNSNPIERQKAYQSVRNWKENYPEKYRYSKKQDYQKHKEKYQEHSRKYYLENRETLLERARNQKSDPIAHKVRLQRRLARKRELPDTLTREQWLTCLAYFKNRCAVCGREFTETRKAYIDHWIPLFDPKCPGTVATNIVCLCGGLGGCNESKSKKKAEKWLADFYQPNEVRKIMKRVSDYFKQVGLASLREVTN